MEEGDQTPKLDKLLRRDRDGKGEYQPIERQRRRARGNNINANAMMDAADDNMKLSVIGDRQRRYERSPSISARHAPRGLGAQHRRIEGGRP